MSQDTSSDQKGKWEKFAEEQQAEALEDSVNDQEAPSEDLVDDESVIHDGNELHGAIDQIQNA